MRMAELLLAAKAETFCSSRDVLSQALSRTLSYNGWTGSGLLEFRV